jgi:hypothetical protein
LAICFYSSLLSFFTQSHINLYAQGFHHSSALIKTKYPSLTLK